MSYITLQNARDSFERHKQDITDVSQDLFIEWCQFIADQLYPLLYNSAPEDFITTQSYTGVTSGAQSLPSGAIGINTGWGTGFYEVDDAGLILDTTLNPSWPGAQIRGYYITGETVFFTGIESAETFILRYIPAGPTFAALADYFSLDLTGTGVKLIDSRFLQTLNKALDVLYGQWDQDTAAEIASDQRFLRQLNILIDNARKAALTIAMPDFSQDY